MIQENLCYTGMIFNRNGKTIGNSLIHRITVNFLTKGLICFRNWCTGKSNEGSVGECFLKHLCIRLGHHSSHIFISILAEFDFLCVFELRSVCLIREAYDISTVVDKTDFIVFTVAELLNGTNIETAAFTCTEFFSENLTAGHNSYFTKVQKLLALGKEFCTLLLQFLSVNDHNDSRRTDFGHVGTT